MLNKIHETVYKLVLSEYMLNQTLRMNVNTQTEN